jgi:hypothetical protein
MSNCSNKSCNNELPRLAKADVSLEDDYCSDCHKQCIKIVTQEEQEIKNYIAKLYEQLIAADDCIAARHGLKDRECSRH